jgi:glycosyltransferase involved in cell wall biosynthesis
VNGVVDLSIVLPILGKGLCLEGVLKFLTLDIEAPYEIILVCDRNELDKSVVESISSRYPSIQWIGKKERASTLDALKQGVQEATGEYILVLCADTAGPTIAVNQMLNLAHQGNDFVSSTRYAGDGQRLGGPFFEVTLSRLANYLLYRLAGSAFTDCTTGLKLFRKDIFERLALESDSQGWVVAFEMALKAQAAGLRLGEVGSVAVDRLYGGESTCRYDREFLTYLKWFFWAFAKLPRTSIKQANV